MTLSSLKAKRARFGNRSLWNPCGIALSALWLAAIAVFHSAGASTALTFADTPPSVQKAIMANIGNGKITTLEKSDEDGQVAFSVKFTKGAQERDLVLGENGNLRSIEVAFLETPPAVQKSIHAQLGTDKLDGIEKTFDSDGVSYRMEITTRDGRESQFVIAENGTLLEVETTLGATPEAVQKSVASQLGNGTLTSITKVIDDAAVTYDVEFTRDGTEKSFSVGADGTLVELEIAFEQATREAQKTIKEKVGNGKIIAVFQSYKKRDKVLPFKVESMKDGKPFNFSVGPKGRFLGVDQ